MIHEIVVQPPGETWPWALAAAGAVWALAWLIDWILDRRR